MASFSTAARLGTRPIAIPDAAQVVQTSVDINWADAGAGIAVGNVVQIADIPAGFEVTDWKIITDDIDSNGTPTVAFTFGSLNAGKTAIATAYSAAGGLSAGQTGGVLTPTGATAMACVTESKAAARTLGLVATAATATAALAGKRAVVLLTLRAGLY